MKTISKIAAIALVAVAVVGVNTASAATVAELQAMIAQLTQQIAALSGTPSTPASVTITTNQSTVGGMTKADVVALQNFLIGKGYNTLATGYFGPMTKAAVKMYQTAKALPTTGYFGPLTMAAVNGEAMVVVPPTTPGTPSTPSTLKGGAGSITVDDKSTYSSEEVKAGDNDAEVLAFEVEADDESDVEVTSIKVELEQTYSGSSDNIDDYIESVSVWLNGKKVGEADADSFSESNDVYTKSIALTGAVVMAGDAEDFVVAVTAQNNLDSGDIDLDAFTVDVLNVRFEDADGVVTTEDTDLDGLEKTFDFEDLATSGDLELKVTEASSNPDAKTVEVDDTSDTSNVTLLGVNLKAEGSDMTVDQIEFTVAPVGATSTQIVKEYKLLVAGKEIDSVTGPTVLTGATGTLVFTDLEDDFKISKDSTVEVKVVADINDLEGTFGNGDSITVSFIGTSNVDDETNTVVEDENGDTVAASDRTGSVSGEAQTFYADGINVTLVSVDQDPFSVDGSDNDRAELVIEFKVSAFGQDAYIPNLTTGTVGTTSPTATPATSAGIGYHVQSSDTGLATSSLTGTTLSSTADEETNSFLVKEGSSETFTLRVVVTNAGALDSASARAILTGVNFASTDSATGDSVYTSDLTDTFKTNYATIAD